MAEARPAELLQERQFQLEEELAKVEERDFEKRSQVLADFVSDLESVFAGDDFALPEIGKDWTWFNVSSALTGQHFLGRITILDFFTYCCVNCLHILPDLKAVEEAHGSNGDVLVVGVHSAKFENERVSDNISNAIRRYGIAHPVVNDAAADWWNKLGIACWPTLLVIGPNAKPIRMFVGEGHGARLMEFISFARRHFKSSMSKADRLPVPFASELGLEIKTNFLSYPGKVFASKKSIFVSDTGNGRVVVANIDTGIVSQIFNGFKAPQGVCYDKESGLAFVADTDDDSIKKIEVKSGKTESVKCHESLSSPWDVCLGCSPQNKGGPYDTLFVAMAGKHQIWALALRDSVWWMGESKSAGDFFVLAGNGREENRNNSYPLKAGFSQPSGICYSASRHAIFVADSESSSVRRINLGEKGAVKNVCGGARDPTDLFAYGDADGLGVDAKLQHPLGVAFSEELDALFVADSYNHKIKRVSDLDAKKARVETIHSGHIDEPGGICIDGGGGGRLFIADTNNCAVKLLTLTGTPPDLSEFKIANAKDQVDSTSAAKKFDLSVRASAKVRKGGATPSFIMELTLPEGVGLNEEAPSSFTLTSGSNRLAKGDVKGLRTVVDPIDLERLSGECRLEARLYLCSKSDGTCFVRNLEAVVSVDVCDGEGAGDSVQVTLRLP